MSKRINNFYLILFLLSISLMTPLNSQVSDNNPTSGFLIYEISGKHENGTEEYYFKGFKQYRHTKSIIKYDNKETLNEKLEIADGENIYTIDLIQKTGFKAPHPKGIEKNMYPTEKEAIKNEFYDTTVESISQNVQNLEKPNLPEINYFGKKCKIISNPFFKTYIWKNIILRREIFIPIPSLKEIKKIELNIQIPDSKFVPPSNIKFSKIPINEIKNAIESITFVSKDKNAK